MSLYTMVFNILRGTQREPGMRRRPAVIFLLAIFLILPSGLASALDVTALYHMGNLGFDRDAEEVTETFGGTDYSYGLSVFGNHRIDESLSLEAGVMYDPVLRKTVRTNFEYAHTFFRVGVGPFLGIFNTPGSIMKSGLSTSVHLEYPGKVFTSLRSDSTIASRFTKAGDYLQELNKITFGYYIPNAICSLNLTTKRFITQKTETLEVDTSFSEYSFDVDIFQKNIPLRLLLSFAYQQTEKVYSTAASSSKNTLNSLIFGTRFQVETSPQLTLIADLDHNIYSFGSAKDTAGSSTPLSMPDSGIGIYLFQAKIGGRWSF